jgi:glutamate-1-semialdehyde 2,1-aminomutase
MEEYTSETPTSKTLYRRAKNVLPAGVSYGVRFYEPYPFFTARAKGSKLYDVDGNEFVDFWLGHTTLILGHSPRPIVTAVKEQLENGTIYGTSHELEVSLAEQVVKMVPSAEMVRFTNSGTEANMYATRLARAFMGRNKIAKFLGGWHGGYDALHVGVKPPFDLSESAGLTDGALKDTILLPFNDLNGVENVLRNEKPASVIIEPVLGAGGGIPVEKEFLEGLREFCDRKDILLIFDEVITGFRLAPGGGQEYFGVTPDITVLGKILGGGFPIGAICASKKIMERMDSKAYKRPNYSFQGGTFVGNPITMTAGLATLRQLEDGKVISRLNKLGDILRAEMKSIFGRYATDVQMTGAGSLFNIHFTKELVKDPQTASRTNIKRIFDYNLAMIANGVFFFPTHSCALSTAHSKEDLDKLLRETETYARNCERS